MSTAHPNGSRQRKAPRLALLAGTALVSAVASMTGLALPAYADNECVGAEPNIECPAGNYPTGIHYRDPDSTTLTVRSGAAVGPGGGVEIENEGLGSKLDADYLIVTEAGASISVTVDGDAATGVNAGIRILNNPLLLPSTGSARVENAATITTTGEGSHGIFAYVNGGTAGGAPGEEEVRVINSNSIITFGADSDGIVAQSALLGEVVVQHSAGLISSAQGDGIRASSNGFVRIDVLGTPDTTAVRGAEQGIQITQAGAVLINNTGFIHGDVNAIESVALVGGTTLINAGVIGALGAAGEAAVELNSADQITITNGGAIVGNDLNIQSQADLVGLTPADIDFGALAIRTTGAGEATVTNGGPAPIPAGVILGRVEFEQVGFTDFRNAANGVFASSGVNLFNSVVGNRLTNDGGIGTVGETSFLFGAAPTNEVVNNFMIQVVDAADGTVGTATFAGPGLEFTNNGLIDMRNNLALTNLAIGAGSPTNFVQITGNYTGGAGSQLGVDADLAGPGSRADELVINGNASGSTSIIVADRSNSPGAYNPEGIVIVTVAGTTKNNFRLDPASDWYDANRDVLDKGLFFYDLVQQGGVYKLVGLPDSEAFAFPVLVGGAQRIFDETAIEWLDRQSDLHSWFWRGQYRMSHAAGAGADLPSRGAPVAVAAPAVALPAAGPGIWAKAIGSWTDRDGTASTTALGTTYTFDTSYKQDVFSIQGGADFGRENVFAPGDVLVFGVMGGYITSDLDLRNGGARASYEGGTIGFSSTYLNGGFFWDTLYKLDFLDLSLRFPGLSTGGDTDAVTYGSLTNVGYRWNLGGWFVEPSATFAYSRTRLDEMTVAGVDVRFPAADSVRGAIGLRVGGTLFDSPTFRTEASVIGRLWHEFSDDNRAVLLNVGLPVNLTDSFEGTFGEVKAGLDLFSNSSGWSGFVNTAVKFNDEFTTTTVKGGIRYQW